jgi:hypothetical protein
MNCPHCDHHLTAPEIRSLNGKLNRSLVGQDKEKARKLEELRAKWKRALRNYRPF